MREIAESFVLDLFADANGAAEQEGGISAVAFSASDLGYMNRP